MGGSGNERMSVSQATQSRRAISCSPGSDVRAAAESGYGEEPAASPACGPSKRTVQLHRAKPRGLGMQAFAA